MYFVFDWYGDHRNLHVLTHSFPTRRSSDRQNRFLRGQAHDLNAMLQVGGKGLTDAVVAEVASALEHHELIKVKVAATDREARDALIEELAAQIGRAHV